ncbi:N-acetyltransferase [Neisseriaceae bacterium PsAf]|nr:N-acetyltransferase [Neisseriaceae bacterium PsAf]MCV2502852.1 N-acetyltransferase [Neisseriaceae bacterium]
MQDYEVINNKDKSRFEIEVDGHIAFVTYEFFDGGIAYIHTVVPSEIGGKGIASYLVKYVLDDAQKKGLKVDPVCPFIKSYIDKHPEYQANSIQHKTK